MPLALLYYVLNRTCSLSGLSQSYTPRDLLFLYLRECAVHAIMSAPNSLGLELEVEKLQISDSVPAGAAADAPVTSETAAASEATTGETKVDAPAVADEPVATSPTEKKEEREKKPAPYVNHNRVLTGGAQRVECTRFMRRRAELNLDTGEAER
jgi:hypothetical protein